MRWLLAVAVTLSLAACSGGGSSSDETTIATREATTADPNAWLQQNGPYTKVVTVQGEQVGLMEDDRMLYTFDCDLANELTTEGQTYGPTDEQAGYGTVCGSH